MRLFEHGSDTERLVFGPVYALLALAASPYILVGIALAIALILYISGVI